MTVAMIVESKPPESRTPTGTSATRRRLHGLANQATNLSLRSAPGHRTGIEIHLPVGSDTRLEALLQDQARGPGKRSRVPVERPGSWYVSEGEVRGKCRGLQPGIEIGVLHQPLQLGGPGQPLTVVVYEEGLDPHSIAPEHEPACLIVPDGEGELTAEVLHQIQAPLLVSVTTTSQSPFDRNTWPRSFSLLRRDL